jgi:hypothetical protein
MTGGTSQAVWREAIKLIPQEDTLDRSARLLSSSKRTSRIIEIGPSHNPIAPKAGGWNSHVVDHTNQEGLRTKYAAANVNLAAIEEVDTIWTDGSLHDALPAKLHGSFDTLIASHVIEHIPDFAGFLISAQRLLHADGTVVLAVPDKRYCFDYFKPVSNTGLLLEAHLLRYTRPPLRAVWNEFAYSVALDGAIAWNQEPIGAPALVHPFQTAADTVSSFRFDAAAPYIDCHSWQFTPAAFALIILELGRLGVIDWHLRELQGPVGCEFYVFLARGAETIPDAAEFQTQRLALLRQQLIEVREQIDFALDIQREPRAASEGVLSEGTVTKAASTSEQLARIETLLKQQNAHLRETEGTTLMIRAALMPLRWLRKLFPR